VRPVADSGFPARHSSQSQAPLPEGVNTFVAGHSFNTFREKAMKTSFKSRLRAFPLIAVALLVGACGGGGGSAPDPLASDKRVVIASNGPNAVSTWNEIAFNTVSVPGSPAGATLAERAPNYFIDIATVQLAVYDAVMAIAGTHKLYGRTPSTAVAGDR